jgi:hypothetical protein
MVFMPRSPILLFDKLILMFCRHFNVSRDENFNVFSVNVFPIKFNLSEWSLLAKSNDLLN